MTATLRRALSLVVRAAVVLVIAMLVVATVAQRTAGEGWWWVELSLYTPYYWLALPCVAALGVSFALGRGWVAASLVNLALLAFVTMDFAWRGGDAVGADTLRVRLMTYNIKAAQAMKRPGGVEALQAEVARKAPDVLVMQDAHGLVVERGAPASAGAAAIFGLPHMHAVGQYIVASRWPLGACSTGPIGFRDESHRYLRCDVDVQGRRLNVVTAHFQSPRSGLNAARREGLEGADEWQQNYDDRLAQAHALARALAVVPRPLVVAGDLNAPESSPVVGALRGAGLRDAFSSAGRGWGFTYGQTLTRGLAFLRIDHILVSKDVGVAASEVGTSNASDHRSVVADLILERNPTSP